MRTNKALLLGAIGAALTLTAATGAFAQAFLTERDISVASAFKIAQAAIAACKAQKYDVSVVILDREANIRLGVRADTASPHNYELARRKAYTALTFHRPSGDWAKGLKERPDSAGQKDLADVITLGGGIPIKIGTETIGAIGVSGSPGQDLDEGCATAGLASIAADLK